MNLVGAVISITIIAIWGFCLCSGQQILANNGSIIFSVPGATMTISATENCNGGSSGPTSFASQQDLQWAITTSTNATNLRIDAANTRTDAANTRIDSFSAAMKNAIDSAVALAVNAAVTVQAVTLNAMMVAMPHPISASHNHAHH